MAEVIFFNPELKEAFESMPNDDPIKKGLTRAMEDIEGNAGAGRLVTKKTHQKKNVKKFLEKYGVENLRIYNLPSAWRLIYSVGGNQIKIIAVLLNWLNHKDYGKLFR